LPSEGIGSRADLRGFPRRPLARQGRVLLRLSAFLWLALGGFAAGAVGAPAGPQDSPLVLAQSGATSGYDPMRPRGGATAEPSEPAPPGNPELGGIPDAPGAEETFYLCSACHSIAMVTQQRLTDQRWDYLWDWMIRVQGMPEQDEETRQAILGYLKTHFSAER
jgi:hypothetical protein